MRIESTFISKNNANRIDTSRKIKMRREIFIFQKLKSNRYEHRNDCTYMFDSVDLRRPVFGALVFHRGASSGGVGRAVVDLLQLAQHDDDFDLVLDHHFPKGANGFLFRPLGGDVLLFANPRRVYIGRIA